MSEKLVKVTKVVEGEGISWTFEVPESYYNKHLAKDKRYSIGGEVKSHPKDEVKKAEKPKSEVKEEKSEAKAGK